MVLSSYVSITSRGVGLSSIQHGGLAFKEERYAFTHGRALRSCHLLFGQEIQNRHLLRIHKNSMKSKLKTSLHRGNSHV